MIIDTNELLTNYSVVVFQELMSNEILVLEMHNEHGPDFMDHILEKTFDISRNMVTQHVGSIAILNNAFFPKDATEN